MKQKLKQKIFNLKQFGKQKGFTLVELMVVISIMMVSLVVVLVGLNQQRISRSTVLASNETVTQIRKAQSDLIFAKNSGSPSQAVKFQTLSFSKLAGQNQKYVSYSFNSSLASLSQVDNVFTDGVVIDSIKFGSGQTLVDANCVQVIFAAPFGKIYMDAVSCDSNISAILADPVNLALRADKTAEIVLKNPNGGPTKKISIYGLTGKIEGQ